MARTIKEIQDEITATIQADETLNTRLTTASSTGIWRLFTYVYAFSGNILEKLHDVLVSEIKELISMLKPHTLRWYVEKIKAFQYGFALPPDTDLYNNAGYTEEQIAASKIVKYAAATRGRRANGRVFLRIKAAKLSGSDLGALSPAELAALENYAFRVADAGVDFDVESREPDKLKQKWTIYYDPLLLDGLGDRIDGTELQPLKNGIKNYLLNLPFNGEFVTTYHQDAVQQIIGVVDCKLELCQVSFGTLPFTTVAVSYIPDAGYLRFFNDVDLEIALIPKTPVL